MSFADLIQSLTLKRMEKTWMQNLAANLSLIRASHDISEIPKLNGRPALVVGAGPSVKNVDWCMLREWKGTIFVCDRMLPELISNGLTPSFATTVDADAKVADFYGQVPKAELAKVKVVLNQTVSPATLGKIPCESLYFFVAYWDDPFATVSLTRIFQELTGKTIMPTSGNTGSAAWNLAYYLECNPVGLLGIDFCYDTMNAQKTTYFETFKTLSTGDPQKFLEYYRQGTTWAGKKVLTDQMFLTYYVLLAEQLEKAKGKTVTYNLGEYSILEEGKAKPMKFESFLSAFNR